MLVVDRRISDEQEVRDHFGVCSLVGERHASENKRVVAEMQLVHIGLALPYSAPASSAIQQSLHGQDKTSFKATTQHRTTQTVQYPAF